MIITFLVASLTATAVSAHGYSGGKGSHTLSGHTLSGVVYGGTGGTGGGGAGGFGGAGGGNKYKYVWIQFNGPC